MHVHLDIPEPLYAEIAQAAAASGQSVETVAIDRLYGNPEGDLPDSFWNPARLAELRQADAEIDAGNFLTMDQLDAQLAANRAAWLERNQL